MISVDLSMATLQQAQGRSPLRVQADAGALQLPDGSVTAIAAALPGRWQDVEAEAVWSSWAVLRRTH
ncbi:hypothetical protein ACWEO4_06555 [Streptomyces sp. NPDC004393]